jgi:hypothetical protein
MAREAEMGPSGITRRSAAVMSPWRSRPSLRNRTATLGGMLRFASCEKLHHAVPRRIEAPEEHVGGGAPEGLHLSLCLLPRPARLCLDPATQNRDRAQNPVRQYSSQSSAPEEAHHPHSGTRQSSKPVRYSPSQASENDRASNSRYEATQPGIENRCASSSSYSNSN